VVKSEDIQLEQNHPEETVAPSQVWRKKIAIHEEEAPSEPPTTLLGILNIITKSRLSSLNLVTVPKMPNLSLTPLKPSCHPQHDMRDAVLKYAIALLNK